jgi:peptidoglycan/LPS O-acetylase OafA/YrhL
LDSLTGIRAVAALGVFGLHATAGAPDVIRRLALPGNTGVSLFFILSGFVLTWTARPDDRRRGFYRRRVARVVPNHVVTWLVVLALTVAAVYPPTDLKRAAASLFLVQAWVPRQDVVLAMNGPSWTLSCEAFFYLVFPFLLLLLAKVPSRHRIGLVIGLGLLLPAWVTLARAVAVGDQLIWLTANLPPVRLVEFAVGVLVALEVRAGRWVRLSVPATGALALVAAAVAAMVPDVYGTASVTLLPYALLLAALAHGDLREARGPLRSRWVLALGVWSYAFYLVHEPVLRVLRVVAGERPWWQIAVVGLVVAIVAAWLLYTVVEHPAERFLRTSRRRRPL